MTRYRAGDAAPIIDVFMKSTMFAASGGSELVENLVAEKNRMVEAANVRSGSGGEKLAGILLGQPVINSEFVRREIGGDQSTAFRAIQALSRAGVLSPVSQSRRNQVWMARGVLQVLDDFAESIRRSSLRRQ